MKKQILLINGGHTFENYTEYLSYLKNKEVPLVRLKFRSWKVNLQEALGEEYDVMVLYMPNYQNARYIEWKIWLEKFISSLNQDVILIGHSLGGLFLVKYLAENFYPKNIEATFLVASPYSTNENHNFIDFALLANLDMFIKQAGKIFLYQSKDDTITNFSDFLSYEKQFVGATSRVFNDKKHFNQVDFPEIVADIKSLSIV